MKTYLYLFALLTLACPSFGQTGNLWSATDDFGAGQRERAVGFSLVGRGYVCAGIDTADQVRNDLWEYDPASATWTQKANMPGVGRRNAVSFTIGNYGYVGTGIDNADAGAPGSSVLNDFWKYDPYNNSWSAIANYPGGGFAGGIYFATAFSLDGKGYVCGGKLGPDTYTDQLWEYKPSADQWALRAPFPGAPRYQLASVVGGNKAYVGFGTDEDIHRKDWHEYNPGSNSWTTKADFPSSERATMVTFTIDGRGYICLGGDGGFKNELWEYVPANDSWITRRNYPVSGRKNATAFVIANRAYVGLGKAATGTKRSFYTYVPYNN